MVWTLAVYGSNLTNLSEMWKNQHIWTYIKIMTATWCSQFFLTLLKGKYQLSTCQNLFSSLFLQYLQSNLVKLVQDHFAEGSLCQLLQKMCYFTAFREAVGASASYSPHSSHIPNILKTPHMTLLRYPCPAQKRLELNNLKAVHKWAIWRSRRKVLQGSLSVQVTRN